eukprot:Nk52_evm35s239 gene=Nk52_evmTU35s239
MAEGMEEADKKGSDDLVDVALDEDKDSDASAGEEEGLFMAQNPVTILLFLELAMLLLYYDRGAFAGAMSSIQDDLGFTDTEVSIVFGCFMLTYSLVAVGSSQMGRYFPVGKIMFTGLLCWSIGTYLTGFTTRLWQMCLTRALSGFGEAAVITFSPAYIDDWAPDRQKGLWMAIYFSSIPIGGAVGSISAGLIVDIGWRYIFWSEAVFMVCIFWICLYLPPIPSLTAARYSSERASCETSFINSMKALLTNKEYITAVGGYVCVSAYFGTIGLMTPKYTEHVFHKSHEVSDLVIGLVALFTGLFAGIGSGPLYDYWLFYKPYLAKYKMPRDMVYGGFQICLVCLLATIIPSLSLAFAEDMFTFIVVLAVVFSFVTLLHSPLNYVVIVCVPKHLRAHATTTEIIALHVLGDVWYPFVYAEVESKYTYQAAQLVSSVWLLVGTCFWIAGTVFSRSRTKKDIALGRYIHGGEHVYVNGREPEGVSGEEDGGHYGGMSHASSRSNLSQKGLLNEKNVS